MLAFFFDGATDADCWAPNSSTHGCVSATFKRQFLTKRTGRVVNKCCLYFIFIPVVRACDVFSARFSLKLRDWSSVVVVHLAGVGVGVDDEEAGDEDEKTDFIQRQQPTMFSSGHAFCIAVELMGL